MRLTCDEVEPKRIHFVCDKDASDCWPNTKNLRFHVDVDDPDLLSKWEVGRVAFMVISG